MQVSAGNRTDTILCSREPREMTAGGVTTDGRFAVWSETEGRLTGAYLVGGKLLQKGNRKIESERAEWRGRIVQVDYPNRRITVRPGAPDPKSLQGRYARITNPFSDCTHLIRAARNGGDTL